MKKNTFYLGFIAVVSVICYYCIAENFLSPRTRQQSPGHIKQEIVQVLADILQTECKSIEIRARVQQEVCRYISQLAENDKNSVLVKANRQELLESLQRLKSIREHNDVELKHLFEVLSFLHDGCIGKKQNQEKSILKPNN